MATATKSYQYEIGSVRWLYMSSRTVDLTDRMSKIKEGWRATIHELNYHPLTFELLSTIQTWIKEEYVGFERPSVESHRPIVNERPVYRAW